MINNIPRIVVERAAHILSNQSYVPMSPAEQDTNKQVNLCLAAAIAQAGLQIYGSQSEASGFARKLERTRSKKYLEQAFIQLGWDVEVCRTRVALNDSFDVADRKSRVIEYLLEQ
jgi:hypothetical protein